MKRLTLAILGVLAATAAHAGPRDDVMFNASRCAGLADDRAWMECYLAAVRPMQAALAGAPAQQMPRYAAPPAAPPARTVVRKRPGFFGRMFGSEPSPPPVARPQYAAPQVATAAPDQFGRRPAPPPPPIPESADRVTARMTNYSFSNRRFTVTLANGQVWQQIDGDTVQAPLIDPPGTYNVTIRKGFLGAYNLTIQGMGGLYRVNRIR